MCIRCELRLTDGSQANSMHKCTLAIRCSEPLGQCQELIEKSSVKATSKLTAQYNIARKKLASTNASFILHNSSSSASRRRIDEAIELQKDMREQEMKLKDVERTSKSESSQRAAREHRKQLEAARRGLAMHEDINKAMQEQKRKPERLARKLAEISSEYGYPASIFEDLSSAFEAAPAPTQSRHDCRPTGRDIRAEIMARSAEFVQRQWGDEDTQSTSSDEPANYTPRPSTTSRQTSSLSPRGQSSRADPAAANDTHPGGPMVIWQSYTTGERVQRRAGVSSLPGHFRVHESSEPPYGKEQIEARRRLHEMFAASGDVFHEDGTSSHTDPEGTIVSSNGYVYYTDGTSAYFPQDGSTPTYYSRDGTASSSFRPGISEWKLSDKKAEKDRQHEEALLRLARDNGRRREEQRRDEKRREEKKRDERKRDEKKRDDKKRDDKKRDEEKRDDKKRDERSRHPKPPLIPALTVEEEYARQDYLRQWDEAHGVRYEGAGLYFSPPPPSAFMTQATPYSAPMPGVIFDQHGGMWQQPM